MKKIKFTGMLVVLIPIHVTALCSNRVSLTDVSSESSLTTQRLEKLNILYFGLKTLTVNHLLALLRIKAGL